MSGPTEGDPTREGAEAKAEGLVAMIGALEAGPSGAAPREAIRRIAAAAEGVEVVLPGPDEGLGRDHPLVKAHEPRGS